MDRQNIEFEQFKLFVKSAENMSNKRMTNNSIMITINTAYISFLVSTKSSNIILYLLGICLCINWMVMNNNYKQRNKIKFDIINIYEIKYNKFYLKEKEKLKNVFNLSDIENIICIIFIMFYIILKIMIEV